MGREKEGYIKFHYDWKKERIDTFQGFEQLNRLRSQLWDMGLVGMDDNGVGFGNLSIRLDNLRFVITGSQTGHKRKLTVQDWAIVEEFDIDRNYLRCKGLVPASSESLTHAAIYSAKDQVNSVIHIHSLPLWEKYVDILPTTPDYAGCGTVQLAKEIAKLAADLPDQAIVVLKGHKPGLVCFGGSIDGLDKIIAFLCGV